MINVLNKFFVVSLTRLTDQLFKQEESDDIGKIFASFEIRAAHATFFSIIYRKSAGVSRRAHSVWRARAESTGAPMEPPAFPAGAGSLQTVRAAPGSDADLVLPPPYGTPPFHYVWYVLFLDRITLNRKFYLHIQRV